MCLFYLYANAKIEIHICSNKHETGLVYHNESIMVGRNAVFRIKLTIETAILNLSQVFPFYSYLFLPAAVRVSSAVEIRCVFDDI